MSTEQNDLYEHYSRMETDELVELHQRGALTEIARPILESELRSRSINPEIVKNIKIEAPRKNTVIPATNTIKFDKNAHEQREIRKTKLLQVAICFIAVSSLLAGYITSNNRFSIGVGLSICGALVAFQTRIYMPKDRGWKTIQRIMAYIIGIVVILSLFVFPNNSDCYIDWDGRSNPTICD